MCQDGDIVFTAEERVQKSRRQTPDTFHHRVNDTGLLSVK